MYFPLNTLEEVMRAFPNESVCIKYLENLRWKGKAVSPFLKDSKIYICRNKKYRCKSTHKYFTVKTGTVFDGTKVGIQQWIISILVYLNSDKDFAHSYEHLQKILNLTPRSIWLLLYKISYAVEHNRFKNSIRSIKLYPYFEFIIISIMKVPRKI
jgi:hypothetical protein